jgi:hypothetical protein
LPINYDELPKVAGYGAKLTLLIENEQLRSTMSHAAVQEAQKHSWYEAMEKLVQGYQEVIEGGKEHLGKVLT